jgi:hypothetical protein
MLHDLDHFGAAGDTEFPQLEVGIIGGLGGLVDTVENSPLSGGGGCATSAGGIGGGRRSGAGRCLSLVCGKPGNDGFNNGAKSIRIESFHKSEEFKQKAGDTAD